MFAWPRQSLCLLVMKLYETMSLIIIVSYCMYLISLSWWKINIWFDLIWHYTVHYSGYIYDVIQLYCWSTLSCSTLLGLSTTAGQLSPCSTAGQLSLVLHCSVSVPYYAFYHSSSTLTWLYCWSTLTCSTLLGLSTMSYHHCGSTLTWFYCWINSHLFYIALSQYNVIPPLRVNSHLILLLVNSHLFYIALYQYYAFYHCSSTLTCSTAGQLSPVLRCSVSARCRSTTAGQADPGRYWANSGTLGAQYYKQINF
jgi:hypothetical protein